MIPRPIQKQIISNRIGLPVYRPECNLGRSDMSLLGINAYWTGEITLLRNGLIRSAMVLDSIFINNIAEMYIDLARFKRLRSESGGGFIEELGKCLRVFEMVVYPKKLEQRLVRRVGRPAKQTPEVVSGVDTPTLKSVFGNRNVFKYLEYSSIQKVRNLRK